MGILELELELLVLVREVSHLEGGGSSTEVGWLKEGVFVRGVGRYYQRKVSFLRWSYKRGLAEIPVGRAFQWFLKGDRRLKLG